MAKSAMERVIALALLCGIGGLVYGVAALALRTYAPSELRSLVTRSAKTN